jgi:hypothetical protein
LSGFVGLCHCVQWIILEWNEVRKIEHIFLEKFLLISSHFWSTCGTHHVEVLRVPLA